MPAIAFPALCDSDLPLVRAWLNEPHVARWFEPLDLPAVRARYEPRIHGEDPTSCHVIRIDGTPAGVIQSTPLTACPVTREQFGVTDAEARAGAVIDLFVGERDLTGRGLGPLILRTFSGQMLAANPSLAAIYADPSTANRRSVRALEHAGFRHQRIITVGGQQRSVMRLPRPH